MTRRTPDGARSGEASGEDSPQSFLRKAILASLRAAWAKAAPGATTEPKEARSRRKMTAAVVGHGDRLPVARHHRPLLQRQGRGAAALALEQWTVVAGDR